MTGMTGKQLRNLNWILKLRYFGSMGIISFQFEDDEKVKVKFLRHYSGDEDEGCSIEEHSATFDARVLDASKDELKAYSDILKAEAWLRDNYSPKELRRLPQIVECKQKQLVVLKENNDNSCFNQAIASMVQEISEIKGRRDRLTQRVNDARAAIQHGWRKTLATRTRQRRLNQGGSE